MTHWQDIDSLLAGPQEQPIIPVRLVSPRKLPAALHQLSPAHAAWVQRLGFAAKAGELLCLPAADGGVAGVLAGIGEEADASALAAGALARRLPAGTYRFDTSHAEPLDADLLLLGWLLSAYAFGLKSDEPVSQRPRLQPPAAADVAAACRQAQAVWLGRDLINTPANDLGPAELAAQAQSLAQEFGASCNIITAEDLQQGFPLIHAVGRGAEEARAPRLIDLRWQGADAGPRITLVGKGVCFDSGGLDIKPASAMALMKKDMGGAAAALACARMIMAAGLPVRLRVLIPAVENAVSGAAFRPGDVLESRAGLKVEVGNTDAEGRLVLADALALADEEEPDLLVDFATLTGAARVALGPDLPAVFASDPALAQHACDIGREIDDPVWPLPLHAPYMEGLKSDVADLNNIASNGFAGAIIAALFLSRFVRHARRWLHFDIYGWVPSARPARPKGGEVQAARLVYHLLQQEVLRQ